MFGVVFMGVPQKMKTNANAGVLSVFNMSALTTVYLRFSCL
jgi:hypothetical protein